MINSVNISDAENADRVVSPTSGPVSVGYNFTSHLLPFIDLTIRIAELEKQNLELEKKNTELDKQKILKCCVI